MTKTFFLGLAYYNRSD